MIQKDIQPAIDMLRAKHTIDNPAPIEDMAAACGIDVTAQFSYREVLDMAEALARSPDVLRIWIAGERRYFATRDLASHLLDLRTRATKNGKRAA